MEFLDRWGNPLTIVYVRGTALEMERLAGMLHRAAKDPGVDHELLLGSGGDHRVSDEERRVLAHVIGPPLKEPEFAVGASEGRLHGIREA